jgi:hypothetical protein
VVPVTQATSLLMMSEFGMKNVLRKRKIVATMYTRGHKKRFWAAMSEIKKQIFKILGCPDRRKLIISLLFSLLFVIFRDIYSITILENRNSASFRFFPI